jgi:molybdopterin converting factor small subunit
VKVTVRLAPVLRDLAGGAGNVELSLDDGATVAAALDAVAEVHPGVGRRVRDEQGEVRRHVNVFAGADNIRDLSGQQTPLADGAELSILPAISGGGGPRDEA